jgi:uncharacterized protein (TIGR03437 family)
MRAQPNPAISAVQNAASIALTGTISPGLAITVTGTNLAVASGACTATGGIYPTVCNGASILVNGTAIPLFSTSPSVINGQVPFGVGGTTASVLAEYNNGT